MHGERSYVPYSRDFTIEAVRLLRESGESLKEVAGDLGVSTTSLWEWTKGHDVEAGTRPGLKHDEQEELKRREEPRSSSPRRPTGRILPLYRAAEDIPLRCPPVPRPEGLHERLRRVAVLS